MSRRADAASLVVGGAHAPLLRSLPLRSRSSRRAPPSRRRPATLERTLSSLDAGVLAAAERDPRPARPRRRLKLSARAHGGRDAALAARWAPTATSSTARRRHGVLEAHPPLVRLGRLRLLVGRREPALVVARRRRGRGAAALDELARAPREHPHRAWREIGISAVHVDDAPGTYQRHARSRSSRPTSASATNGGKAVPFGRAPVAQWKSGGLLSRWSEVRILPGALCLSMIAGMVPEAPLDRDGSRPRSGGRGLVRAERA